MCTLTIIPWNPTLSDPAEPARGVRVVCNRDESRLRAAALPPRVRTAGSRRLVMPIDPASDGTWIAASDAGLVAVLMNVYGEPVSDRLLAIRSLATGRVSRGTIVPEVLQAETLERAIASVGQLDLARFEPFRVVVLDRERLVDCVWWQAELRVGPIERVDRPRFFTSSGLGDELVATPRRRLFDELFSIEGAGAERSQQGRDWPACQDAFHRHFWPDNRQASVWMTRPEALTVSRSEVLLTADSVALGYHARVGDSPAVVDFAPISLAISPPHGSQASGA